jgi:hypothetical protein
LSLPVREGAWEDVCLPFFRKSELVLLAWGGDGLEGWPPCEVDETPLEDEEFPPEDEELGPDEEEWFLPVREGEVEDV